MPTLDFKDKSVIGAPCNIGGEGRARNDNSTQLPFEKWIGQTPSLNRLFGTTKVPAPIGPAGWHHDHSYRLTSPQGR